MPTSKPLLRIRPALPTDAPALQAIRYAAFRPTPISQGIWPGRITEDATQKGIAMVTDEIESQGRGPKKVRVMVAEVLPATLTPEDVSSGPNVAKASLETNATSESPAEQRKLAGLDPTPLATYRAQDENGREQVDLLDDYQPPPIEGAQIVAFAKWHLFRRPRDPSEWDVEILPPKREELGEGANLELWDAFIGGLRRIRRRVIAGDAHFILSFIATSPAYHRMGAAGMLIRWGTSRADAVGLNSWLEATPAGYHLYKRHGFRDIENLDINMVAHGVTFQPDEDWGLENGLDVPHEERSEGWYRNVLMKRAPEELKDQVKA